MELPPSTAHPHPSFLTTTNSIHQNLSPGPLTSTRTPAITTTITSSSSSDSSSPTATASDTKSQRNREAQRSFRIRRENYVKSLESEVKSLEETRKRVDYHTRTLKTLQTVVSRLNAEKDLWVKDRELFRREQEERKRLRHMMIVDNARLRRENERLQEIARDMGESTREFNSKRFHTSPAAVGNNGAGDASSDSSLGSGGSGGGRGRSALDLHELPPPSNRSIIDVDATEVEALRVSSSNSTDSAHASTCAASPSPPSSNTFSPELSPPLITTGIWFQQQRSLMDPPPSNENINRSRSHEPQNDQLTRLQEELQPVSHINPIQEYEARDLHPDPYAQHHQPGPPPLPLPPRRCSISSPSNFHYFSPQLNPPRTYTLSWPPLLPLPHPQQYQQLHSLTQHSPQKGPSSPVPRHFTIPHPTNTTSAAASQSIGLPSCGVYTQHGSAPPNAYARAYD